MRKKTRAKAKKTRAKAKKTRVRFSVKNTVKTKKTKRRLRRIRKNTKKGKIGGFLNFFNKRRKAKAEKAEKAKAEKAEAEKAALTEKAENAEIFKKSHIFNYLLKNYETIEKNPELLTLSVLYVKLRYNMSNNIVEYDDIQGTRSMSIINKAHNTIYKYLESKLINLIYDKINSSFNSEYDKSQLKSIDIKFYASANDLPNFEAYLKLYDDNVDDYRREMITYCNNYTDADADKCEAAFLTSEQVKEQIKQLNDRKKVNTCIGDATTAFKIQDTQLTTEKSQCNSKCNDTYLAAITPHRVKRDEIITKCS